MYSPMFLLMELGKSIPREKNWIPAEPPSQGWQHGAGLPCGKHVETDVCLAHQRSPVVASVSAHMPNSFKTSIWEKTLYAILFTSPISRGISLTKLQ